MQISVCGCGWLGLPLAQKLISNGHQVVATKRSEVQASELSKFGIQGLSYTLGENLSQPYLSHLFKSKLLLLNIPPGRKAFIPETYVAQMMDVIQQAKERGVKQLIFISTSAVYGDSNRNIYEYSEVEPNTTSARAHVKLEQFAQHIFGQNACILRLSGLVGKDRHPVKFLAGKTELKNGQKAVNLVHLEDVISAVEAIIERQVFGHTLHISSVEHPTRKAYYQWSAKTLGLAEPEFLALSDVLDGGKKINADFTIEKLGLKLAYPSPYDMLSGSSA